MLMGYEHVVGVVQCGSHHMYIVCFMFIQYLCRNRTVYVWREFFLEDLSQRSQTKARENRLNCSNQFLTKIAHILRNQTNS